jgi:glycosyltransferase involved in cell wall biosynthesis
MAAREPSVVEPRAEAGSPMNLAFVGAFPDPLAPANDPAHSPAGTFMQQRVLASLGAAGVDVDHVFALRTAVSFPRGRTLLYPPRRWALPDGTPASLLPFVNVPPLKQLTSGLAVAAKLLAWALRRRGRPRAMLLYNVACPPGIFSILAGRLTRTRVYALVADLQVPGSGVIPDTPLHRLDYWLQRRTLRHFDGLIVLTTAMATDHAPSTPAILMEGAVPPELEAAAVCPAPIRTGKDAQPFTIMYAGQLSDFKGLPLLLAAFARLPGDRYRLWITGKGEMQADVEAAATLDPRIVYWGFPPYEQVLDLYRSADVLVNPHSGDHGSSMYCFPSKLLEYLATGTPVITTRSTPEVEEEYGGVVMLLQEDTPEELMEAVLRLEAMSPAARRALGEAGRRLVLERKSWSVQARRIADMIRAAPPPAPLPAAPAAEGAP